MLPLRARVDLRAIAMKGFSGSPKAPSLLGRQSNYLVSYLGHAKEESYFSAEKLPMYSAAQYNWVTPFHVNLCLSLFWVHLCLFLLLSLYQSSRLTLQVYIQGWPYFSLLDISPPIDWTWKLFSDCAFPEDPKNVLIRLKVFFFF